MDKIHVRFSVSQPCLTDAVIVILNGLLSYEHPSNVPALFVCCRLDVGLPVQPASFSPAGPFPHVLPKSAKKLLTFFRSVL